MVPNGVSTMDPAVRVGSVSLPAPVMVASGCFDWDGYGNSVLAGLDAAPAVAVLKTATLEARAGNPEPRLWPGGFGCESSEARYLNSVGLANPGLDWVLGQVVPELSAAGVDLILSLAADDLAGWGQVARKVAVMVDLGRVRAVELNLSCPNVEGALWAGSAGDTAAAVAMVCRELALPVWAKLAPNVADIERIAAAAGTAGAEVVTVSNTLPALALDVVKRRPVLGGGHGGLSGGSLHPVAVALVDRVRRGVGIPVIGCGGVFSGWDAAEFMLAGAAAVQMGTGYLVRRGNLQQVNDEVIGIAAEQGLAGVADLTGLAEVW